MDRSFSILSQSTRLTDGRTNSDLSNRLSKK